jgi:Kef-type K+ transport system membrane component KefB
MSELAYYMGISHEIGAFIAGVTLTISPVSHFIAERLKPLRDFFLIVFFFSVGASINFMLLVSILVPVLVIAFLVIIIKPLVYKTLMPSLDGSRLDSWEFGLRLGQASEFSLLVAFMGFHNMLISQEAYLLVQAVTVLSFIASSYIVGFKFPGHLSVSLNPTI